MTDDFDTIQRKLDETAFYLSRQMNETAHKDILFGSITMDAIEKRITHEEYNRRVALLGGSREDYLEVSKLYGPKEDEE